MCSEVALSVPVTCHNSRETRANNFGEHSVDIVRLEQNYLVFSVHRSSFDHSLASLVDASVRSGSRSYDYLLPASYPHTFNWACSPHAVMAKEVGSPKRSRMWLRFQ